jgi:phosphopantothenoylcysteine decarboxylase/phosphopantothenate--cysteine ligase
MRRGADVYVVMTQNARKIIHPFVMEWATGNPVVTELTGKIEHVELVGEHSEKADMVLIAPATANTISKIASGIDDTTVTTVASTAIGAQVPIIIVPAMHSSMYNHFMIKENTEKLQAQRIDFVQPRIEEEKAKIAETEEIIAAVVSRLLKVKKLLGKRFLVTSGRTIEYIDNLRVLTNRSSGKMGTAIAEEAQNRGAEVTFVCGLEGFVPNYAKKVLRAETAEDMANIVKEELKKRNYDVVVAVAAVTDWKMVKPYLGKVSTKKFPTLTLKLRSTPKIVDEVKKILPKALLVVFRAEFAVSDEELVDSAYRRLKQANADLAVGNDVSRKGVGFGTDTNEVFIVDKKKTITHVPLNSKNLIAEKVLDAIENLFT